jgi:hypothetical protein
MTDSHATTNPSSSSGLEPPTQEIFVGTAAPTPGGAGAPPWDDSDPDEEWPDRGPRKGIRMSVPTVVLLGLLLAAGGIWGGAALQRNEGTSSGTTGTASSLASLFRSRATGTGGFTGGFGATTAAATGTVTEVSGTTLYVTNDSGALVKVTVGPSATVTRDAKVALGSLQLGDTVVVDGTKASNGSVTATSVSATGAGVTSRFGFTGAAPIGG